MPAGRPPTSEETKQLILEYVKDGNYPETAAKAAGISVRTLYNLKEQPEFLQSLKKAISNSERLTLLQLAMNDKGWQRFAWILERRFPERWRQRNEVTIQNMDKVTDEEIRQKAIEVLAQAEQAEQE